MSDFDLDRLGDVWRRQLDPAEMERLQRTAAAVSRRARFSQILDIVAGVALSAVVIVLVWTNPALETFLMGGAAILLLLGSHIRLRKLRQVELRSLAGSTEDMLDQSIERVSTTLRHNRFTLIAMGPGLVFGILLASVADRGGGSLLILGGNPLVHLLWMGGTFVALAGVFIFLFLAVRRGRRELERLQAMRESYRQERKSSGQ
ncbi:MAG TPA: hypothetical protein VGW40_05200 [Allosphingosinicella sp.]|nr:hypothetical protein [Allosphingosinicella sp.]